MAPGDVYIIAHPSADPTILAQADHTFSFLSNGDDGFMLVQGDETSYVQIDAVGDWNGDPGSGWEVAGVANGTQNHTIVRKASVQSGNAGDWVTSAGTNADDSEWIVLPSDDWTSLGAHTFDGCGAAVLGCTNPNATNYNADATQDDGSCLFDNACNVDGVVVEASSFQYVPSALSVQPGQTVVWVNLGGTHDVNGDLDSQTGMSFGNPKPSTSHRLRATLQVCASGPSRSTPQGCTRTIAPLGRTRPSAWWPRSPWEQGGAPTQLRPTTTLQPTTTTGLASKST